MKLRVLAVAIVLLTSGLMVRNLGHGEPIPLKRSLSDFPAQLGGWSSVRNVVFEDQVEERMGTRDYVYKIFLGPEQASVHFYVGYYASQRHGTMIHSPKSCLPGSGWYITGKDTTTVDLPHYAPFEVNNFVVENGSQRQVVLYWYQQSGGRVVTNEYLGRVYLVFDNITKNRTDAALVRVNIPVNGSIGDSVQTGLEFLKHAYPQLMEFLPHDPPRSS